MNIEDIVDVIVSVAARPITQTGFETPLFITPHQVFTERYRIYTDADAAVEDGFDPESPAVVALNAFFGQDFAPSQVVIGTRQYTADTVTIPATVTVGDVFSFKVVAKNASSKVTAYITYTAITGDDATDVAAGLATAFAANTALAALATATPALGVLTIAPKASCYVTYVGPNVQNEAAVELEYGYTDLEEMADALYAITAVTNDYFFLTSHSRDLADIRQLAAYAESNKKIYAVSLYDPDIYDPVVTDDIASEFKTEQYDLTMLIALSSAAQEKEYHEAGAIGAMAALQPGSTTLHGKTLSGCTTSSFTTTQENTIIGKNANIYTMIAGVGFFVDGKMSSGTFFDIQHGRLWLETRMEEDIFSLIKQKADSGTKIPYTDEGISMVVAKMSTRLQNAVDVGFLAALPRFKVNAPLVADIPTTDKINRFLPDIPFEATLAGAIHRIKIRGVVAI